MTERWDERIATTWFGPKMPPLHAACVASWIASGRRAIVYSYRDRIEGLPPKAEIHDGSEILPEKEIFFRRESKAYAHFSDIFRMEMLRRGLGVWCDADFFLLRDFPASTRS